MKRIDLPLIIKRFDHIVKTIDFNHLPARDSEEYRQLLFQTANDVMFSYGRYNHATEMTLEMFDYEVADEELRDLSEINKLTDAERVRLSFYVDLKDLCYPLFRGRKVDYTAWPWLMKCGDNSLDNQELFDFIDECKYPGLSAVVLYNLQEQFFCNDEFFSSVARNEMSETYSYDLESKWKKKRETEEERNAFAATISKIANDYWFIENHMYVGRQLGFDIISQSVYDAFDTFIDRTYRHNQVDFARELGAWLHANWTIGEAHPAKEKFEALDAKMKELMEKHGVSSPNMNFTWNLICFDALGASMFTEEELNALDDYDADDDDLWNEPEV